MSKKVGIFIGSLRKKANSKKVANALVKMFPDGYEPVIANLDNLDMFNQDFDEEDRVPPSWKEFRNFVGGIDAALFITPEYNRSMTPVLKNALDIASRPYGENKWDGKPAAVVSSSIGQFGGYGANWHIKQPISFLNMPVLPQPEVYLANVHTLFDNKTGELINESTEKFLQSFVDSFVKWIDLLS